MNCKRSFFGIAKFNHLKDYYAILNIAKTNDQSIIKKAYYALAKQFHPDVNNGKEDKFKEVNEAYEILSDENVKRDYDIMRSGANSNSQQNYQQYQDPRRNYANQQQQSYRANSNYNQQWNTRNAYEQAFRQAQQNFYYQQQSSQKQYNQNNFQEEQRKRQEAINQFAREAMERQQREFAARQQYYEHEKRRQQFYSQREKEAYEEYLRQREYEQYQKEKFEEYKYKAQDIEANLQNIHKNWDQIKQNVSSIWNAIKGKKD